MILIPGRARDDDAGEAQYATIYTTPEHEQLREQIARFIAREVEPHAAAWEEQGCVPRDVLRRMGQAGLFGLMYESRYGGAEADALTNLVFAEALSQSTFAGFIITVLVHTDMASPHLHHAGSAAQKARYLPQGDRRRADHGRGHHRAGRGVGRGGHPHLARGAMATSGCSTAPRCSSPTACTPTCTSSRPRPAAASATCRCSSSRRARRALPSAAR